MTFGIALGSNLGDRMSNLQRAVAAVLQAAADIRLCAASPVYETAPVDCPDGSGSFYNSVIEIRAELEPLSLLRALQRIEAGLGRPNEHERHAPRTVDLDLLYADDAVMNVPELVLPHPRLHVRRFVLQPLADIRPDLVLPGQSGTVSALLKGIASSEPELAVVSVNWADRWLSAGGR